jgi:hypothetical protein
MERIAGLIEWLYEQCTQSGNKNKEGSRQHELFLSNIDAF